MTPNNYIWIIGFFFFFKDKYFQKQKLQHICMLLTPSELHTVNPLQGLWLQSQIHQEEFGHGWQVTPDNQDGVKDLLRHSENHERTPAEGLYLPVKTRQDTR